MSFQNVCFSSAKTRALSGVYTDWRRTMAMMVLYCIALITVRAKLSGAVYCYRSCLWRAGGVCLWVCYHDNSKLRASIFTKLGL